MVRGSFSPRLWAAQQQHKTTTNRLDTLLLLLLLLRLYTDGSDHSLNVSNYKGKGFVHLLLSHSWEPRMI